MGILDTFDQDPSTAAPRHAVVKKAAIGMLACFLALAMVPIVGYLYLEHRLSDNITQIPSVFEGLDHRPARAPGPAGDAVNILIMGTDRRSEVPTTGTDAVASPWVPGAQRSDTLMILHLDADREAATVVSIPRDTWVEIPGHGMNKINAAYSFGGATATVETVELLTNVRIDHLAIIDWSGFEALIDAVGGIDVVVPETVSDSARGITWRAGSHHLSGAEALDYVGQRYGLPNGDLDRVARQQVVLRTLMEHALHQEMLVNPRMLYDFLDTVTSHLAVDEEWSTRDMLRLGLSMHRFRSANLTYLTMPISGFGTEGAQSVVYADTPASRDLWSALAADTVADWVSANQGRLTPPVVS
ncbi:LytR family transcriptional regulator [Nocardioides sp. BGMRC 2183]|nr:LytR family transcriptional regulator [Nocardioides sp. BGMRC 2183]